MDISLIRPLPDLQAQRTMVFLPNEAPTGIKAKKGMLRMPSFVPNSFYYLNNWLSQKFKTD